MNELMLERHSDIVEAVVRWRSLTLRNLQSILDANELFETLKKRVQRLEAHGILKSKLDRKMNKVIYPSNELIHKLGLSNFNEENLAHDAVVSLIVSALSNFQEVKEIKLPHEYKTKTTWKHQAIEPDAIVTINKNGKIINVAIELELWRKDRKRVFEKFIDYAKAYEYGNIFYFFADRPSFNSYKQRQTELLEDVSLTHLKEEFQRKFIFIHVPLISKERLNLYESEIYQNGEEKKLGDLLI